MSEAEDRKNEHMTENPTPIAELSFEERTAVLFDDGAVVDIGVGDWSCSEHGGLGSAPREECDHHAGNPIDAPSFDGELLVDAAATDRTVQDEVLSRLAESDPERLAAITEQW